MCVRVSSGRAGRSSHTGASLRRGWRSAQASRLGAYPYYGDPYYYGYGPNYYDPSYYDDAPAAVSPDAVSYCAQRFRTYNPATGMYIGRGGVPHCPARDTERLAGKHDLFGEPLRTFPDHALGAYRQQDARERQHQRADLAHAERLVQRDR